MTLGTLSLCVSLSLGCDDKGGDPGEAGEGPAAEAEGEGDEGDEGDALEGDDAEAEASVEARIDVEAIAGLISSDATIKTGAELEAVINDSRRGLHSIDVDADGQVDYIRVFELRADGAIRLELQAIPSSSLKVEEAVKVATIALTPAPAEGVVEGSIEFGPAVDGEVAVEFSADAKFEGEAMASAELPLISWSFDAERPVYEGSFALKAELDPADFQLAAVADAITSAEVKTAAELEAKLNAPDAPLVKVDIDADGTLDHVQVVELRADADAEADAELAGAVAFDLRAVPSSVDAQFAVSLGSVVFTSAEAEADVEVEAGAAVEMTASYSSFFSASAETSITHEWKVAADAEADADAEVGMHTWVLVEERPVYYSAYVRADGEAFIPPGHVKHGHWKAQGASADAKAKIKVKTTARPSGKVKVKHKVSASGGIFGKHKSKKHKKHKKHKSHKKSKRSGGLFGKKKAKKKASFGKPKKHKKSKSKSKSKGKKRK